MSLIQQIRTYAQSSRLLTTGFWYVVSLFFVRGLNFAVLPVYTWLMDTEAYGTASIFLTWLNIFIVAFPLYMYMVPVRGRFDIAEDEYDSFISSITSLGLIASVGFLLLLWLIPAETVEALLGLPKPLALIAAGTVPFFAIYRMVLYMWQAAAEARRYTRLNVSVEVLIVVASLLFIVVPAFFDPSFDRALGRIFGVAVVRCVAGLIYLPGLLRGRVFYHREYWRYALLYAVPLIPHALSIELLANFDRVIIAQQVGTSEAGIYSFAYQLGYVVAMIAASLAYAWMPWFYETIKSGAYALVRKRTRQYLFGFTALTAVMIVLGPMVVMLLSPPAYAEATRIVPLVMAGGYFSFLQYFFITIESNERKTWYTGVGTLVTAVLNIGLNLVLIPRFGYLIAGWTTLISYAVLFGLHAGIVRIVLKTDRTNDLRLMIVLSLVIVGLSVVVHQIASMT